MKKLHALAAAAVLAAAIGAAQAQAVRPEVGKPLQQASELLRAGKAKEALAKVREADAVGGKTAAEQTMIERMRGAAAQRAGDNATAIQAFEALFPKLSGADAAQVAEQLAFAYSQQKDWPRTSQWAQKAQSLGSSSAQLKQLLAYVQSQSGDYNAIAREAAAAVSAAEQVAAVRKKATCCAWPMRSNAPATPPARPPRWTSCSRTTRRRNTGPSSSAACHARVASPTASRST